MRGCTVTIVMNRGHNLEPEPGLLECQQLIQGFYGLADRHQNDAAALLRLLRELEQLHQAIREDFFQAALPPNRRALCSLLRDIEAAGGWPFIPRMKLQTLLEQFNSQDVSSEGEA